jgi:hypothetical protein
MHPKKIQIRSTTTVHIVLGSQLSFKTELPQNLPKHKILLKAPKLSNTASIPSCKFTLKINREGASLAKLQLQPPTWSNYSLKASIFGVHSGEDGDSTHLVKLPPLDPEREMWGRGGWAEWRGGMVCNWVSGMFGMREHIRLVKMPLLGL